MQEPLPTVAAPNEATARAPSRDRKDAVCQCIVRARQQLVTPPCQSEGIGTTIGGVVGDCDPAAGSTDTAIAAVRARSTGPDRKWTALPWGSDWNSPAGIGAPPFGTTHIS